MRRHRAALVGMALLACCLGAAKPTVSTVPTALQVLVMGNSEAGTLALGSPLGQGPNGLSAQPGLTLLERTILGCSISSVPEFVLSSGEHVANRCGGAGIWQQRWAADVAAAGSADVVFLMAGDRDLYDVAGPDGAIVHPGDPAWSAAYTADVEHRFRFLRAGGAPLVAVTPPPCFGDNTLAPPDEAPVRERLAPVRVHAVAAAWPIP